MSIDIPKVTIAFGTVAPPQSDLIDLRVHLGCTNEVSSFEMTLQNWDKKYSPSGSYPISVGLDGHIDVGRGLNVPQIITCRVESVKYESTPTENYLSVSGRCWGEKLFRRVVTKTYENQKGEAIVKDLLDYYVGLSHNRGGTELVEDTDTTYLKLEYENAPVFNILKYITDSADKAGVIGFDFRIAPDGKFEFFPRNTKTSPIILSDKIEASEYRKDIFRVRNQVTVYGAADKSAPFDKDAWTESLSPADGSWSVEQAENTISLDATSKVKGSYSIKTVTGTAEYAIPVFTLSSGKEIDANAYLLLSFYMALTQYCDGNIKIRLCDASGKTADKYEKVANDQKWHKIDLKVGSVNALEWVDVQSGFDWTQIKKIKWSGFYAGGEPSTHAMWIDALFFGGRRYSSTQEDSGSQSAYGLRELVEVDEELYSNNECMLRAKALLANLKDPAEYLTIRSAVLDYDDTLLLPGDKIHVTLPNENVGADFRILSVEYNVDAKTQTLEISMELGREAPLLADYLYALRSKTSHLSRYKIARVMA
jgi:hypothetical protein